MLDKTRIINYADCTIVMQDGTIKINVGSGVCDLKIEHNKVTVDGNLVVNGSIKADSVSAGGVSLASHKHSGVTSGSSNTGNPV